MRTISPLSLSLLLAVASLVGCSNRDGLVPVSGTVMIDGKPLTKGQVMVIPSGHRPSVGVIDENGRFTLSCYKPGDGVPVGTHPMAVTALEQIDDRSIRWFAPKKYADQYNSGLTMNVEGAKDDMQIDLTWQGSRNKGPYIEKF